jgi:hypothetical protein
MTIHDVPYLGNPDAQLARIYSSSLEHNTALALEAKRLDHTEVFATLRGLLEHPPPPYSQHPPLHREHDLRKEREIWEQAIIRKKLILDEM